MSKQETESYIKAKETLTNCVSFGDRERCAYIQKGIVEECLGCENYMTAKDIDKSANTLTADIK